MITDFEEPGFVVPENASAGSGSFTAAEKRTNRTKMKAMEKGVIVDVPSQLAIPSIKEYQYGLSTVQRSSAHLLPSPLTEKYAEIFQRSDWMSAFEKIKPEIEYSYDSGAIDESEWLAHSDCAPQIDITLLAAVYTIIVRLVESQTSAGVDLIDLGQKEFCDQVIKIYAPSFFRMTGNTSNLSTGKVQSLLSRLRKYQAYLGILDGVKVAGVKPGIYPVLPHLTYNQENNAIELVSPYLTRLAVVTKMTELGQKRKPAHTFCVNAKICKTKSSFAKEMVLTLTTLIEQRGNRDGKIKAETVLNRCPMLLESYSKATTCRKDHLLKSTFREANKLIQTETRLLEKHPNLRLPTDEMIPSATRLDEVIKFIQEQKEQ